MIGTQLFNIILGKKEKSPEKHKSHNVKKEIVKPSKKKIKIKVKTKTSEKTENNIKPNTINIYDDLNILNAPTQQKENHDIDELLEKFQTEEEKKDTEEKYKTLVETIYKTAYWINPEMQKNCWWCK